MTSANVGGVRIETVEGDITVQHVDAVVNAANSTLLGGGGVDGAIHRAGGPEILAECRQLRRTSLVDGLAPGEAVATGAGRMPATFVIHAVGPVWSASQDRTSTLAGAYLNSLRIAGEVGAASVAFPAISAGVYGWPLEDAARVAVTSVIAAAPTTPGLELVRFVLFSDRALAAFEEALEAAAR